MTDMVARGNADAAESIRRGPGNSVKDFLAQATEQNNVDHDIHPSNENIARYKNAR